MAVHANPDPQSLAFKLSKMFHIDLSQAEMCVHKTTVTVGKTFDLSLRNSSMVDRFSSRATSKSQLPRCFVMN